MTIPYKYQQRFNSSHYELESRIDEPVCEEYIEELLRIPDFCKAYEKMDIEEFDTYGPVNVTLEQFAGGYDDLVRIIRSFLIRY